MDDTKVCDSCHNEKPVNRTDNRLVIESCGHVKCMDCLLLEKSGCKACLRRDSENGKLKNKLGSDLVPNAGKQKPKPSSKQEHTEDNGDPSVCEKYLRNKPDRSHITIETDEKGKKSYLCLKCNRNFYSRSMVVYHSYCNGTQKPYLCTECNKGFVSLAHYRYHLRVHRNERAFPCDVCGQGFFTVSKMQRHKLKHSTNKDKRYACKECTKSFDHLTALRKHTLQHTKERPYKCDECGVRFRDPSNFRKHMHRHSTNGSPCRCSICGRDNSRGEARRPHQCPHCARAFYTTKDLRRHVQVHTDSKPFRCKVCNRRFRRKDNLERHIRNTHPNYVPATAVEKDETELEKLAKTNGRSKLETTNKAYENSEKSKLQILNPLPPLPQDVMEKHMQVEKTAPDKQVEKTAPNKLKQVTEEEVTPVLDSSTILEANTARQSVIVSKCAERKVSSPVQEYVHKMRKAKSMRGQKDVLLPPIDETQLHEFLEIESNLNVITPHPKKNLQILKNILGVGDSEKSRDKKEDSQSSGPEVHWRKKKLNLNW